MAVLKDYNESSKKWEGVGAGYISNDDGTNKATPNEVRAMKDKIDGHAASQSNPHATNKSDVGLGNVDNVKQASKAEFDSHVSDKIAHGGIGSKNVDETNLKDNYTLRYDGLKDRWVMVDSRIDRCPPAKATSIELKTGDKMAALTYTPPSDSDYMGTRLVYNTTGTPASITDGTFIANYISGAEITGLLNDRLHYFRLFPYDASNNYNTEAGQSIEGTPKAYQLYGVKIDVNNSNPQTAVTYTDMAIGFTPAFCNNGSWQMGSWEDRFPYSDIKPCMIKNGVVNYYLNPGDYTKKASGGNADITSGNDGDVMVEFPRIYWKFERVGNSLHIRYSDVQIDSGYKCLAHTVGSKERDSIYVSAYKGHSAGGKLRSLSGKPPHVNATIGSFRTLAQANGSNYQQFSYYPMLMLQVLALVMGKNRDTQTQLGRGYVDGNSSATNTGKTNAKGMFYGEKTGKQQNKFCGVEDFYGNVFDWVDGLFNDSSRNILISDQTIFNDSGSGYVNQGKGSSSNLSGYVGDVQGGTETGFIIKSSNGSSTTHYSDSGSLTSGSLGPFGGNWNNGDSTGAFALPVTYSASNSDAHLGSRLLVL